MHSKAKDADGRTSAGRGFGGRPAGTDDRGIKPMTRRFSTALRAGTACLIAALWPLGDHPAAWAQQPPAPPPGAPAAPAPAAPAGPTAMTTPIFTGPLVANPDPLHFDVVPF